MMKRLPPALVIGLVFHAVMGTVHMAMFMTGEPWRHPTFELIEGASPFVFDILVIAGLATYLRGLTGERARGVKIAIAAQGWALAMTVFWLVMRVVFVRHSSDVDWFRKVDAVARYASSVGTIAGAAGFLLATAKKELGVIALVLATATTFPPVAHALGDLIPSGRPGIVLSFLPYCVLPSLYLAMLVLAEPTAAVPTRIEPAIALRAASSALYLRLWTALGLAGVTLMMAVSRSGGQDLVSLFKLVTIAATLLDIVGSFLFARGALRLAGRGVQPWLASLGAAGVLFAAGAMLTKLPMLYLAFYGQYAGEAQDAITLGAALIPIVACAGIYLVLRVVVAIAAAQHDEPTRENVSVRAVVFVVLSLGVVFVTSYGFERMPHSQDIMLFMMLAVAAASLYALALAGRICREGAELLERGGETSLPVAKVV